MNDISVASATAPDSATASDSAAAPGRLLFEYLPVGLFGSVMGLTGLSIAWRLAHARYGTPAWIEDAIGVVTERYDRADATQVDARTWTYPTTDKSAPTFAAGGAVTFAVQQQHLDRSTGFLHAE